MVSVSPAPSHEKSGDSDGAQSITIPRIAGLILAAGRSQRMGPVNKLLTTVDGVPMLAQVVDAVVASMAAPVFVVTGHERQRVEEALRGRAVRFVHNPDFDSGLSTTLGRGLAALADDVDGALVCLGDMPWVTTEHVNRLMAAFAPSVGQAICVPTYQGRRGNPVLWARRFFAEMQTIQGDVGARHLIGKYKDLLCQIPMDDNGILLDVDTPEALRAALADMG